MARIIDLGNGYGRIEGYTSQYANLTFPLTKYEIQRLFAMEVISEDEARKALQEMGYDLATTFWALALSKISTEQWKEALNGMGTI